MMGSSGLWRAFAALVSLLLLAACGSRGDPRPPLYPNPPAIDGLTGAQRGAFAVLRFPPPPLRARVGSEDVELEEIEVLVYAERYPVLTVETLRAGLERRRDVMMEDAAAEAAAAAARAAVAAAVAAGEPPPPDDPDAPATTVRRRAPDEDFIHRLPVALREEWRRQGLSPDAELVAARRLVNSVNALWSRLGLPATVLDAGQPQPLPSNAEIARASAEILESATYERQLAVEGFLGRASVSRRLPVDQFDDLLVDDMLQVAIPVGVASGSDLRTRYFFAVRGRSSRDTPGQVTNLVAIAPAPVPVSPSGVEVEVGPEGVRLSWNPPAGDLALRRVDADSIRYNVYRMPVGGLAGSQPLNSSPISEAGYTDGGMQWGETYVYEVRALLATEGALLRESEGSKTEAIRVVDRYPPAPVTDVDPTRAGNRVALRWTPSPSIDILGYRIYRHPVPAPEVPARFDPTSGEPPAERPLPAAPAQAAEEVSAEAGNEMVEAGWQLLTENPVPFSRFTDPDADPSVRYVYAVEAIDAAGNLSALAVATEPAREER